MNTTDTFFSILIEANLITLITKQANTPNLITLYPTSGFSNTWIKFVNNTGLPSFNC